MYWGFRPLKSQLCYLIVKLVTCSFSELNWIPHNVSSLLYPQSKNISSIFTNFKLSGNNYPIVKLSTTEPKKKFCTLLRTCNSMLCRPTNSCFPNFFALPQTNMIIFGVRALFWELRYVRYISLLDPLLFSLAYYMQNHRVKKTSSLLCGKIYYRSFISRASTASPPPPPTGWLAFERSIVEPNNFPTWPISEPSDTSGKLYDCARLSYV